MHAPSRRRVSELRTLSLATSAHADLPCPRSLLTTAEDVVESEAKPDQGASVEQEKGQRPETMRPAPSARQNLPGPRSALATADDVADSKAEPAQGARAEQAKGQPRKTPVPAACALPNLPSVPHPGLDATRQWNTRAPTTGLLSGRAPTPTRVSVADPAPFAVTCIDLPSMPAGSV